MGQDKFRANQITNKSKTMSFYLFKLNIETLTHSKPILSYPKNPVHPV